MKKTLAIFLSMAVLLCAVPHVVFAADSTTIQANGLTYELNDSDKTATLTKGTGGSVEIPGSVNYNGTGYTVTTIGDSAFKYCSLTSLTMPNSVTSIGDCAFKYCRLTSLTIGSGVKSIGDGAFSDSGLSLETINVANNPNLEVKDGVLFNNADASLVLCSKDKTGNYEIPGNITTIVGYAFYNCSGLTSVTIGSGLTTIGDSAFYSCSKLASITIPGSVTTIGEDAFQGCSKLTSVTIPCNFDPSKFEGTSIVVGDNNTFTIENYSSSGGTFVFSHDDINKVERREPDCVNDGEEEHYKCSGCNTLYDDAAGENIISEDSLKLKAPGHDFGEWETTKAATCTTAGEKTRTCKNGGCGESQTEPIPATGHKLTKTEKVEPTCVAEGKNEYWTCSQCNGIFSDAAGTKSVTADELKLSKVDHNWGTGEVTTAATPEKPGVKTYTCSVCGETKTEPVEYVSVPGGGDSNSTNLHSDAGGSDNSSTNSYSDTEPAVMAKRATIKTGDQLGLWVMFDMALLLISVYGALVGVKLRRKKYKK